MDAGLRAGDDKKSHLTNQLLVIEFNLVLVAQQDSQHIPGQVIVINFPCYRLTNYQ